MHRAKVFVPLMALAALLACGGGSNTPKSLPAPPTVATSLVYSNPTGSYQLVRNAALSTPSHLVLDLTGPTTPVAARGIALVLTLGASTQATWAPVTAGGSNFVQEGAVFNLGTGTRALVGRAGNGGSELQVALFQKGPAVPAATLGSAVLASVALDLKAGASPGTLALAALAGKAFIQDGSGASVAITPAIGSLSAQ